MNKLNQINHWDSYGVFAIATYIQQAEAETSSETRDLDSVWDEAISLYNRFVVSKFNDANQSELDCIYQFLDTPMTLKETEMGAILEFVESSYDFPKTDYVLYNRLNNSLLKDSFGCIIVYGDIQEASADRNDNELVISCNQLPSDLRRELLKQINNG